MSLENNIERIALATERNTALLERIAAALEGAQGPKSVADSVTTPATSTVTPPSAPAESAPTPPTPPAQSQAAPAPETTSAPLQVQASAPTPPAAPVAEVPPSPPASQAVATSTAAAAQPANLTADELNKALVEEFKRLGNKREPIDTVMREQFNVQSITDLKAEQYQPLLDAVRAVKAA